MSTIKFTELRPIKAGDLRVIVMTEFTFTVKCFGLIAIEVTLITKEFSSITTDLIFTFSVGLKLIVVKRIGSTIVDSEGRVN